jgi:hopanoid biosynthesis associated RND transporter like protein HpnN
MRSESRPDILARAVAGAVAAVARHPRAVLAAALALTVASVAVACLRLGYHTQRNDLLSAGKPCQQRWQKYLDAFGNDDDLVVVAEGTDPDRMKAALDAVAEGLKRRPDLFDRVFHTVDLTPLRDRAILHLPADELDAVAARVGRMEPLLGPLGPVAWRMLSVQSLLGGAAADPDLLAQLPAVLASAAAAVRDSAAYRNPWVVSAGGRDALSAPRYLFTPDGSLALLTCRPRTTASFTPAREANAAARAVLADVGPRFPGVSLGLTGLPVLETDEMELSEADSARASWLALLGVAALYAVVYRGRRYPLLTVGTLVIGTLWALGWATVTVGHLNILSAAFAVMLIGLGDYGVLWVARYDDARGRGLPVAGALRETALHAGPSILTAAATTGLAFFAVMLADFKAVAELGWIAGSGVLLCAASCVLLMPALLVLTDRRVTVAAPAALPFPSAFLPGLSRRPRAVLAVGAVVVVVGAVFAGGLRYDHNLLNLQPRGLDSVLWEHKLIDRAAGATWDALSVARTREEALALKRRYEALPEVGRVVEVASLVPADQDRKLAAVRAIHDRLARLPPADELPAPVGSDPATVRDLAAKASALPPLAASADALRAAIDDTPDAADRLRHFDRRLAADLAAELHHLRSVSHPIPIIEADVPAGLRERYRGANGEYLVRAFARDSLWDYAALERFTAAAAGVDPEATGKSFRTLEGLRQMKAGFERAAGYALLAIVAVLLLDLRRLGDLALALLPLAAGVVLTLGAMGLCGVPLNPANMIALPLVVGVGVDNGVHVLHDYRGRDRRRAYRLGSATGRGVLVAALTTVLGFGTLTTARHQGMASLGLALTLGVTFCMLAALVLLPAVLHLLDRRRLCRAAASPVPAARALAAAA